VATIILWRIIFYLGHYQLFETGLAMDDLPKIERAQMGIVTQFRIIVIIFSKIIYRQKNMFMRKFVMVFLLLTKVVFCSAQDISDKMVTAFNASYNAEAAKDYGKAIECIKGIYSENSYEINLRFGWLYYLKKDNTSSEKYYTQALKLRPNSLEAMFGYIYPVAALEKWADVFAAYLKILKLDPTNSYANYQVALMYFYKKEFATAVKHLQVVVDHYPFDYDSILLMAQTNLAMGNLADSKSYYQRALLYYPSNEEIKKILSKL
jgi:tetratricopeptide (TPR) repeat protein